MNNGNFPNKIPKIILEHENDFWLSQDTSGKFFSLPSKTIEVLDYFHYDELSIYDRDIENHSDNGFISEKESSQEDGWNSLRREKDTVNWSSFNSTEENDD